MNLLTPETSNFASDTPADEPSDVKTRHNLSALNLLIQLAQRRRFILLFTVAAALLTALVSLLLPLRYTAAIAVLPPQQSSSGAGLLAQMASAQGGGLAALAGAGFNVKNQNDMYVAMFRSRTVEDAMVQRFDLVKLYKVRRVSDARMIFEERSTVVAGLKDGIIRASVDAATPQMAADMANAYLSEFQKLASGIATTEAGQRRLFFDQQLEDAKNQLSQAEQDLKRTELTTGFVQPDSQARAMMESAATIQGEITARQVQLQGVSTYATESNPQTVVLRNEIAELRAQLSKLTGNSSSENDLFVPKGKVPDAALDYVRKLREVKYRETLFQALATQFQLAKLDEAKQGTVFQVIDRAIPPDKRSYPHRSVIVLMFTFLGFLVACLIVWTTNALTRLGNDPEDGPKLQAMRGALRWRR